MLIGIDAHNLEGNRTGVGRVLFSLLKEWKDFQMAKFILYFKDEIPADLPKSERFEFRLLKVSSTAKFIHWDLCRTAKKDKVDILFCPGYVAPILYPGKIALMLHDIIYESHPEWFEWKSPADKILLKWVSKISAHKAKLIFTISEFSRQEIIRHYKIPPEKVILTYLAADIGGQAALAEIEKTKIIFDIKDEFAFYAGSIFNRRHLPEVISTFVRIAEQKPELQLLLAGKDHTKPPQRIGQIISDTNEKLGRQAVLRVDFVSDNDLKLLYSACAFFIWLSDYEGFGLPPLEAMSCSAPVITSDAASLKEVVGQAALLIKNNSDVDEIYQAMKKITADENFRRELAERGREQAAKFSWEKCAKEILEALSKP